MGVRIKRREDPALITGAGQYTADIKLDGTLYMALARSPYAHAKILDIDTSEAKAMAGVVAVLTGADINPNLSGTVPSGMPIGNPPYSEGKVPTRHVLSTDKVRFMGEPVAVVVAKDPYTAVDALETIFVDYDPLDVVTSPEAALADGAPLIHDGDSNLAFRWGPIGPDVSETFANAAHTIELRIENQRVIANAMEPRAALASYDGSTDSFTIWSTTQSPHGARDTLAGILGTEPDKVRVIAPEVGGGFGIKAPVYTEEIIAAYLTRHLGQPVKWVATRSEDYVSTYHGRGQTDIIRLAADADGRILAADLQIIYDAGAYFSAIAPLIPTLTVLMMVGVYAIPTVRAEITAAFTNRHPADPYRGAGRPEAAFMIERAVDALAQEMGLDAAEIRRRNYIAPDAFPYTTPTQAVYDSGEYARGLEKALELIDYDKLRKEQAKRRQNGGKLMGIGLATYVEVCGFGPWEMGSVYMDEQAKVTILTGTSPHGQGHETAWAQIAADTLQIPIEDIVVKHGDTAVVPRGIGTFGSRSTVVGGSSVRNNSESVRNKAQQIAAHLLEAAEADVTLVDGRFQVVGVPERTLSWQDVAAAQNDVPEELKGGLEADTDFAPEGNVYPFGTHVAVVEVDPDTGATEIIRYLTVDDCGRVINPLLVEGQVHGGIAQGIGQALYEAAIYDDMGNLISGSMLDYAVPRINSFPHYETNRTETPSPINPLGVKGIGEAATIGSTPTIVNAVVDALSHLGVRHVDMPLTAEKIWQVLQSS
jgi:carbon-monoxide dehydrogenase large subunit